MALRIQSPLLIAAISVAALVLVVVLGLSFMDWNLLKGPIERTASARFGRPVTIAGPLQVRGSGRDLAQLFYLTQITLPNSPPFKVRAHIARQSLPPSDPAICRTSSRMACIGGTVQIDASTKRPSVKADLLSKHLLLEDFAAITGSKAQSAGSLAAKQPGTQPVARGVQPADQAHGLFPDARLQVDRGKAIDADVRFRATSIEAGTVPFTEVSLHVRLDDSRGQSAPRTASSAPP